MQPRVKIWFMVMLLLDGLLASLQVGTKGLFDPASVWFLTLLVPSSVALAIFPWVSHYFRVYLRLAPHLVSAHSVALVSIMAIDAADGRATEVGSVMMPIFFFCGLLFRQALISCGITVVTFLSAAILSGVPSGEFAKAATTLLIASAICTVVGRDMERSYRHGFLKEYLAAHDGLTNVMNRRTFDEHLLRTWMQGMREQCTVAVLLVDVDDFKRFNDTFGHLSGDVALKTVANALHEFAQRPLDLVARYGGDEFAIILYDPAPDYLINTADEIVRAVRSARFPGTTGSGREATVLSVSVGAGIAVPTSGRGLEDVVQAADEALYEAKRIGRDRAVVKGPESFSRGETGRSVSPHDPRVHEPRNRW
jgi:diguanylate cyclase (GGDEF)-like protein